MIRITALLIIGILGLGWVASAQRNLPTKENIRKKREAQHEKSKKEKSESKILKTSFYFRPQFSGGMAIFSQKNSPVSLTPRSGFGGELDFGFKVSKNWAIGFGFNTHAYFMPSWQIYNGLKDLYENDNYYIYSNTYKEPVLTKVGMYVSSSYWEYHPKYIFEVQGKLAATNTSYRLDQVIFRRSKKENYSEYITSQQTIVSEGIMPSLAVRYAHKLNRSIYFIVSGEYGYNIIESPILTQKHYNSLGEKRDILISLPSPNHFLQVNIGFMFRPHNRVKPKEKKFENYNRLMEKNN